MPGVPPDSGFRRNEGLLPLFVIPVEAGIQEITLQSPFPIFVDHALRCCKKDPG
jgi:hypothetical protein